MKTGTKTWHQKVEINKEIARTLLKTLRLMGYTDDYQIVVSRAQTYKQAGNSIVVDVMMALIKYIISTKALEG